MKLNELEGLPELGNTIVIDGIEYVKKRKHLTGIEISQGFQTDDDATHPYSYWSGVDFAEKAHGIGGEE
jgi:hypothetical protein